MKFLLVDMNIDCNSDDYKAMSVYLGLAFLVFPVR